MYSLHAYPKSTPELIVTVRDSIAQLESYFAYQRYAQDLIESIENEELHRRHPHRLLVGQRS